MTMWRYKAVTTVGAAGEVVRGEQAGETASAARSALHGAGLRVLELKPLVRRQSHAGSIGPLHIFRRQAELRLRSKRGARIAELYDALATMLEAGVPLVDAVESISSCGGGRAIRTMAAQLADDLRSGQTLADAMSAHPSWFDRAECAMIRAGQHSGELPGVIRTLSERHCRAGDLSSRLASALVYPAIVAAVGIGVVIFLSTKTLPELTMVLTEAERDVPALTLGVMSFGRSLLVFVPWVAVGMLLAAPLLVVWAVLARRLGVGPPRWPSRVIPQVVRRAAAAEAMLGLAELLRSGVPAVEALRVLAPTATGPVSSRLGARLVEAAGRIERGESLAASLDDPDWFPDEVRRLVRIGEQSGELDSVLDRLGRRYRRSTQRLIDRLAALLEPAVILVLAVAVGVVVMAAVLPLVRLQEVL
jgi:type II secretory pathway component PulF